MATRTSQGSGDWSNAATWDTAPADGDDVIIAAGHSVLMDTDTSACEVVDGRFEIWVNGVSVNSLDWPVWDDTYSGQINGGYILGWANSGFADLTTFYIDDFKVYNQDPGW